MNTKPMSDAAAILDADKKRATGWSNPTPGITSPAAYNAREAVSEYQKQLRKFRKAAAGNPLVAKRLELLERAVSGLQAKVMTLYNHAYAKLKRRAESSEKAAFHRTRFIRLAKHIEGNSCLLHKLGKIFGAAGRGRMLMMFSPQQRYRLNYLLRPKGKGFTYEKGPAGTVAVYLVPEQIKKLRAMLRRG